MTDVDRIRVQWVDDLRNAVEAHKHHKLMQVSTLSIACLFKALDAERSRADAAEDARRDAIAERRAFLRATRCRCEPGMPGHCPGPASCPYCQDDEETTDAPA